MMNATSECPSATMASAISAATSASVRPGTRNSGTRACTRSIAAPALRSASISARVLDHPQSPQHVGGQHRDHAQHVGQRQQVQRRHRIGDRGGGRRTAQRLGHQPVRVIAVDPVAHRQTEFGHRGLLQRRQLQPRHHDGRGLPSGGGQHQRGQPFERLRARADQVAQVVSRRDDQAGQAGIRRGRRGCTQSPGVDLGAESAGVHSSRGYRCHGRCRSVLRSRAPAGHGPASVPLFDGRAPALKNSRTVSPAAFSSPLVTLNRAVQQTVHLPAASARIRNPPHSRRSAGRSTSSHNGRHGARGPPPRAARPGTGRRVSRWSTSRRAPDPRRAPPPPSGASVRCPATIRVRATSTRRCDAVWRALVPAASHASSSRWDPRGGKRLIRPRAAGDLDQIAIRVAAIVRRHRAERTDLRDGSVDDLHAALT